jgi:hypothetical protein
VTGMYAWCQGCGHGGHLQHMDEWFQKESVCPVGMNSFSCVCSSSFSLNFLPRTHSSGCGHECNLKPARAFKTQHVSSEKTAT